MENKLIFVISPPRSGSTLLQRLLGSHTEIMTHPEPHLITPMAYLGYYDRVEKAPYDHINAAEALKTFVSHLPQQEEDYLDALRAYSDTMYARLLDTKGKRYFLDKTPAYALVAPFLTKLYPGAHYIVLTRHPLAIFSSYANSFFEGDWQAAYHFNPIVEKYVRAIAQLLRDQPQHLHHVRYESLVEEPEKHVSQMFAFLGLDQQLNAVNYGANFQSETKGMGDPTGVHKHQRPVTDSVEAWVSEVAGDETRRRLAERMLQGVDPVDLQMWGYTYDSAMAPIHYHAGAALSVRPRTPLNWYTFQRKVLMGLRKNVHNRPHGKLLKKVKYYCDVILRDTH